MIKIIILHTLKNIEGTFLAVWPIKLCVLIIDNSKPVVLYRGQNAVHIFIETILKEHYYCKKVIKKHFDKNLVMSKKR